MNYEMRKSLVDDLNDTIVSGTKDFEGRPFYIRVYEKWDLQMKKALLRRMYKMVYRPYPEADSLVFKVIPSCNDVYWCWELPARHEMLNELNNPDLYDAERLMKYRHWENMRLEHFGFTKNYEGNWIENPMWRGDIRVTQHTDRETTISLAALV